MHELQHNRNPSNPGIFCEQIIGEMMNLTEFDLQAVPSYEQWLSAKIRQLSVDALAQQTLTCNACGEVLGTYIIEYESQTFRLPGEETFAFLSFIVEQS